MKKTVSPYNPANLLSMLRIVLVPVFVVLLKDGKDLAALIVFITASVTDFIDGYLARRFHWQTRLGEFIDPMGDKLLTLSAFVLLYLQGHTPFWVVVLAFAREFVVVTGFVLLAVLMRKPMIKISFASKAGTLLQMFLLGFYLGVQTFGWPPEVEAGLRWALAITIAGNFIVGLDYAIRGIHDYEKSRKNSRV